jgi:hypothetical protein
MSLNLTTLLTRIGHQLYTINTTVNTFRGTSLASRVSTIAGDFTGSDQNVSEGIYAQLATAQSACGAFPTYLQGLARSTLLQMAAEAGGLPNGNLATSMQYVVNQFISQSQTVKASVVGSSVTPGGSNIGNANIVVSTKLKTGQVAENAFAETITATCTNDAQSGGATAGRESVQFLGQLAQANALSWLWPAGSGCSATGLACDATRDNQGGTGNWLANSDFETWTVANTPDNWHYGVGSAGTAFLKSTLQHHDGAASLQWVGDSSTLATAYQELGVDTTNAAKPSDQLAVNFAVKVDVVPAGGVLTVELVDGSGTAINDGQGNANSFTVTLSGLTTAWAIKSGVFRTPAVLPASVRLRFRLSTALSTGSGLFLDHVALAQGTSLYVQGPSVWVFANATNLILNDTYAVGITNTPGGIQRGFEQLFGMRSLGYLLPSAGSPTMADGTYLV